MSVPESIRKVPRPTNTVVVNNGKPGLRQYSVRERSSIKYIPGGNPQPHNGKVIGYIYNNEFHKIESKIAVKGPDMLSYGSSALVRSLSNDLFDELSKIYQIQDAATILVIACLRVIKPAIPDNRLASEYKRTFLNIYYPGIHLSANTVSIFQEKLGMDMTKRLEFYRLRASHVIANHHIAIDGTLKQDNSIVNDLSAFSYKARKKRIKEVSVLYAYDIEKMEPICAEVFPGNCIDASAYKKFICDNDIHKGMILSDKGFPPSMIKEELENRPLLHFLTPIKRNDKRIQNNKMLEFQGVLNGIGEHVLFKKCELKNRRFLYSFKNSKKAANEEAGFLAKAENKDFDKKKYQMKKDLFGVIVFESDEDMTPETVYRCYEDRWLLELVFNQYKNDEGLDETRVHGDYSVYGSEFINFISTVITCRIINKARSKGLLKGITYGALMEDLSYAWRLVDDDVDVVRSDDNKWVHVTKDILNELELLDLSEPIQKKEPKKRGRPKKNKDVTDKPKRPRGRPRKIIIN